jgi:hypothetical protein
MLCSLAVNEQGFTGPLVITTRGLASGLSVLLALSTDGSSAGDAEGVGKASEGEGEGAAASVSSVGV